jgi:hypothetical protein
VASLDQHPRSGATQRPRRAGPKTFKPCLNLVVKSYLTTR